MLIEIIDELCTVFSREMTTVMILNLSVGKGDDITSDGHVVGAHLIADACRFKRSPTLIHLVEVVAKNGCVGNLRAWLITVGHCDQTAAATFLCQHVHIWSVGILQQCFAAEAIHCVIGHSVA